MKINTDVRRLTLTFHGYPGNAKFSRVIKYRGAVAVFKKFKFHVTENTLRLDEKALRVGTKFILAVFRRT